MKAVTAGQMRSVSASQINTWTLCARRHYFEKVLGMPQEETEPMRKGTATHKVVEDHYGGLPRVFESEDPIVAQSITRLLDDPRVPAPRDTLLIEFPRDYNMGITAAGIPVKGRIDLIDVLNPDHIHVWDWKTTGKLKNAKSAEELLTNPQYLIYSKYIFERFDPARVTFSHGNIQTSAPGHSVVTTEPACREEIDEKYTLLVESTVEKMKVTTAADRVEDVPRNEKSCFAFGRPCPYTAVCPLNSTVSFTMLFNRRNEESSTMPPIDVKELLNKQLQAQNGISSDPARKEGSTVSTTPAPSEIVRAKGINPPDAAKPNPVVKYVPPSVNQTIGATTNILEAVTTPQPEQATKTSTAPQGLYLFIDSGLRFVREGTLPWPVTQLSREIEIRSAEVIAEARKMKKANEFTVDVRQIAYGEGTTALIASFKTRPLKGTVIAHSGGLSSAVLEVLETQADLIVGR